MTKKNKILLIAGIAALVVCVAVVLAAVFFFGGEKPQGPAGNTETATYTIEVQSASGLPQQHPKEEPRALGGKPSQ